MNTGEQDLLHHGSSARQVLKMAELLHRLGEVQGLSKVRTPLRGWRSIFQNVSSHLLDRYCPEDACYSYSRTIFVWDIFLRYVLADTTG